MSATRSLYPLALDNVVDQLDSGDVLFLSSGFNEVVLELVDDVHGIHGDLIIWLVFSVNALTCDPQDGFLGGNCP